MAPDMPASSVLERLLSAPLRPGRLCWIGLRPARRAPLVAVSEAALHPEGGLAGDHAHGRLRQVTLIQAEHLAAIAAFQGMAQLPPEALRRNLVVTGLNLLALKGWRFGIGAAVLEATGPCHPCSRMEEALGRGGYNAVRGHGGITARVVQAGPIRLGDAVVRLDSGSRRTT
jgi:MOSC domain-containing protein YiiM